MYTINYAVVFHVAHRNEPEAELRTKRVKQINK